MSVDAQIILTAMQTQLDALTRAVRAQQDAIDALTDSVITLQAQAPTDARN